MGHFPTIWPCRSFALLGCSCRCYYYCY